MVEGGSHRRWVKGLLVAAGFLFVGLGVAGIVLPLLPTTPFLLLAAACFARSSERFYRWLLGNRWFGAYVKNYREGRGVPAKVKIFSTALLWVVILSSAAFAVSNLIVRVVLIAVAVGVTVHIVFIRPKKRGDGDAAEAE
ncbi:MAG: DUF454 family protein [candidate division Zixibacteria bacterium]|nr:DUF454 family protein [candidate division Zixibacteria bacterium]